MSVARKAGLPRGEASARATLRGAISLLAALPSETFVLGRAPRRPLTRSLRSEAGDSTNRNSLCPTKLGQDLPMAADATPCGARCRSAPEDWSLLRQARGRRPALCKNHPGPKILSRQTVSVRAPFPTQPSRRDGRPTPPPGGETQRSLRSLALPLASTAHQTPTPGHPAQNNGLRPRAWGNTSVSTLR